MNRKKLFQWISVALSLILTIFIIPTSAKAAIGTAFTYQGQLLVSGSLVSGSYDFQFTLYDSQTGGSPKGTPVNQTLTVTNGYFCTNLDFGANVFNGTPYWLETAVRPAGTGSYNTLGQRQALNPSPYAIYAASAASVADASVTPAKISPDGASTGQSLIYNGSNVVWDNIKPGTIDTFGSSNGQVLISDGINASWGNVSVDQPTLFSSQEKDLKGIYEYGTTIQEITVARLKVPINAGQKVKIDYAFDLKLSTKENWEYSYEIRLYRANGSRTLIDTRSLTEQGSTAGSKKILLSGTYVDTASGITPNTIYFVDVITTSETNMQATSASNRNINAISFPKTN